MISIRVIAVISSLICGRFVVVHCQSVVDETETSSQCVWNNEEYIRQSFERTCRPTQQLLMQMKRSIDAISAQLMTVKTPQTTTDRKYADEKQHLVSALTGTTHCETINLRLYSTCAQKLTDSHFT